MSQVSPDAIERLLSRRGYRLTAPRRNLLEVMASLGDHFSADAVVGAAPEAIAMAMLSGIATMATVTPAKASLVNCGAE